jgi:predicted nucleic-acid-binding protein
MKIIADTNVLLRAALQDDREQGRTAVRVLERAEVVVLSRHALCEFVWVLSQSYKFPKTQIVEAINKLIGAKNVLVDQGAVEAGFEALKAGADFADGVIAYEGTWLGGETFVSFDKKAVTALEKQGQKTRLLA